MRVNGIRVAVRPMRSERVDGACIMRDPASGKVIVLNGTASVIWNMIVEYAERNMSVCTSDLVSGIVKMCGGEELGEGEVQADVEGAIGEFFSAGLLRGL